VIGEYEENTVVLGDTIETLEKCLGDCFDLVVTSPPYYNARPEYAEWGSFDAYESWLWEVFGELGRTLKPGRRLCWNIADYAIETDDGTFAAPISACSIKAAEHAGLKLRHWIVWEDPAALARRHPTGTFPHGSSVVLKHSIEFVIVFQKPLQGKPIYGKLPPELEPYNQMGPEFFRTRVSNQIWSISRKSDKTHPAVFPEELVEPLIRMWSRPGDLVCDPFMGSGTTALSALLWRRKFFGIERDTQYHAYALGRIGERRMAIAANETMNELVCVQSDSYTGKEIRAKQIVLGGL
jgi:site-specific DNA-methyltransferase (adenine-specific)